MAGMHMEDLPQLTWSRFFGTWSLEPGWLVAAIVLGAGYCYLRRRAGSASTVHPWRGGSFLAGLVLMWVSVASAIGGYAMSLFWMHMVLHLILIMVVPGLLVLGHPVTVLVEGLPDEAAADLRHALKSFPLSWLGNPVTGILAYSVVIFATHLTGFMDTMAMNPWLMPTEEVLYVVAGYLVFLPLIGEEPIGVNVSYLFRLLLLFILMVPDTVVGLVLLQNEHDPFPMYSSMRPSWTLDAVDDAHVAGGLMWAAGDGLMMIISIGLMISVVTSPSRRTKMTGSWMEGARRSALIDHLEHTGTNAADAESFDPDGDEALEAYNRMLARLRDQGARDR